MTKIENRLAKVEDAVSGDNQTDFVNRTSAANEYTYFADGSLKTDGNEDIQNIVYDSYLKKPIEIQMTGSRWIKYTYNGHGALLRRELSTGEVWDYVGNMILKNNQYYQINMPEGRVVYQSSAWHQEYEYRDQVGNLRVAFRERNDSLVMIQAADFSPFGVQFNSQLYSEARQNFEYQGHESQPDHGLRRIMMGARCLNPTIGRMDGVDNFASAAPGWSSYRFAFNNPNMYTDPDGNFEQSNYTSSSPVEVHGGTFNNGFREVSFRAAGYSVGYFDFSGQASGEYRQRAGSEETGRIFNYKGDPNNVKVSYDDYQEWVPGNGPAFSQALPNVRFRRVGNSGARIALDVASYTLTGADLYNNFAHNHTSYTTTRGLVKNIYRADGTLRSARAAQFAKTSRYVRGAGVAGTALMGVVAAGNIYQDAHKGADIRTKDITDLSVSAVGISGAVLTGLGIISNPIGWVIGGGVAIYGVGSLAYDLLSDR